MACGPSMPRTLRQPSMPCGAVAPIRVPLSLGRGAGGLGDGVLVGVGVAGTVPVGVGVADRVPAGVGEADVAEAGFLLAGGLLADVSAIRLRWDRRLAAG